MRRFSKTAFVLGTVSSMALASAAFAQNPPAKGADDATTVDELVVTAQKREENVKDVPVSINVVGEAQIARQQIYNVYDLSRTTPALELTNAAGQFPGGGGQIRGIGTQTFGVGAVGSVGIVVDGVSQGNVNITDLFDIQRIEVLKGPQGTLFGLTTSAGVINIVTQAPDFRDWSFKARTELSGEGVAGSTGYGQQIASVAMNIPLASNAAMRISGNVNLRQGPGRNALDDSLDEHDTHSARARLLWRPTERLDLNFNADYSQQHGDGPDFFTVFKSTIPSFVSQLANCRLNPTAPITPVVPSDHNRDYCTTTKIVDGSTIYGGSFSADYRMEPFTLTSITAARRSATADFTSLDIFRLRNAFFLTPIPVPPFVSNSGFVGAPSDIHSSGAKGGYTDLVTQELRIASPTGSKVEYTLGGFYSNQTSHNPGGGTFELRDYTSPGGPGFIVNGLPVPGGPSTTADFSAAVFGQATWHLNDKFALIAGGRYTEETLRQNSTSGTGVVTKSQGDINNTSYRFGAQYKFDDTLQTYATYARGYKGPQFATVAGALPGTPLKVVQPEEPENYEIGAKKTMFDGRAILDLSAFYTKVKNYQGQVCAVNPTTLILGCTIDNFDGVISKGVEANLFGRISDHLTISTGIIYNPATYPKKVTSATGTTGPFLAAAGVLANGAAIVNDLSGEQLVNAPLWKATFSGEYSHDFNTKYQGFVSADAVYRSEIRLAASLDPDLTYPNSWVYGGRLGVRSMQGWSGAIFVRNAGDEHIPTLRQSAFPASQAGVGNSYGQFLNTASFRVVGISLDVNY